MWRCKRQGVIQAVMKSRSMTRERARMSVIEHANKCKPTRRLFSDDASNKVREMRGRLKQFDQRHEPAHALVMSRNRGALIPTPPSVSPDAKRRLARLRELQPLQPSVGGDQYVMDLGTQHLPPTSYVHPAVEKQSLQPWGLFEAVWP